MSGDPGHRAPVDLAGRVVVVTGGNSGIGLGMARGAARAGAAVAVWARRAERSAAAVEELSALGANAVAVRCDVADEQDVERAMTETVERFGRLDTLVANAGISAPRIPFIELSTQEWRRVLAVNLDGTMYCLRAAARVLVEQGSGGALVVVSSTSAIHGAPGQQAYAVSKTGVLALVRGLAVELARHHVRVNGLLPGWTETGLTADALRHERFVEATTARTPLRRWATGADFEEVGAFLCDPSVTFHTGDAMVVDGGYTVF